MRALALLLLLASPLALGQDDASSEDGAAPDAEAAPSDGYVPDSASVSSVQVHGYVDVGFAKAQGSSFARGDTRLPADYGVDAFAPAVNSRGDVASLDAEGRFVNGFLPRSLEIGDRASFFVNTASLDVQYAPPGAPVLLFTRAQFMPRFRPGQGTETRVLLQQAFGRVIPFDFAEFALTVGKFDPVFGIEYLENEAPLRVNVTPSLMARYTTGHQVGAKAFYRMQFPRLLSALSLNAAVTNNSSRVESLQTPEVSLTGRPHGSARLGYELQLLRLQLKLGASGQYGPRNDQRVAHVLHRALGADARITAGWLSLSGEFVRALDDQGVLPGKETGLGAFPFASGFHVRGFYATAALALPISARFALRTVTPFARYDQRNAGFDGFGDIRTSRITAGARLDLWELVALKAEYLLNREESGAPRVDNDVFTASAVGSF